MQCEKCGNTSLKPGLSSCSKCHPSSQEENDQLQTSLRSKDLQGSEVNRALKLTASAQNNGENEDEKEDKESNSGNSQHTASLKTGINSVSQQENHAACTSSSVQETDTSTQENTCLPHSQTEVRQSANESREEEKLTETDVSVNNKICENQDMFTSSKDDKYSDKALSPKTKEYDEIRSTQEGDTEENACDGRIEGMVSSQGNTQGSNSDNFTNKAGGYIQVFGASSDSTKVPSQVECEGKKEEIPCGQTSGRGNLEQSMSSQNPCTETTNKELIADESLDKNKEQKGGATSDNLESNAGDKNSNTEVSDSDTTKTQNVSQGVHKKNTESQVSTKLKTKKEKQKEKDRRKRERQKANKEKQKTSKEDVESTQNQEWENSSSTTFDKNEMKQEANPVEKNCQVNKPVTRSTNNASSSENVVGQAQVSKEVVFHALLSPHFRYSRGDQLVVRYGVGQSWNKNYSIEMEVKNQIKGRYHPVTGRRCFPLKELQRPLSYKYAIRRKNGDYHWEFLYRCTWWSNMPINRVLYIPEDKLKNTEVSEPWIQYDDAVYPERNILGAAVDFVRVGKIDPKEGCRTAVDAMLPKWKGFQEDEDKGKDMLASEALKQVDQLIYCVRNYKEECEGYFQEVKFMNFDWKDICRVFIDRLKVNAALTRSLKSEPASEHSSLRLVSALAIAYLFSEHGAQSSSAYLEELLESLAILGDGKSELQTIRDHFPSTGANYRCKVVKAVLKLCNKAINERYWKHEWLFAIPLVHFLAEESEPYKTPIQGKWTQENSWWGAKELNFKKHRESCRDFGSEIIHELSPLLALDPLAKRTLLLSVHPCLYESLFDKFDMEVHDVMATMVKVMPEVVFINTPQWESIQRIFMKMVAKINGQQTTSDERVITDLVSSLKVSLHLLEKVLGATKLEHSKVVSEAVKITSSYAKKSLEYFKDDKEKNAHGLAQPDNSQRDKEDVLGDCIKVLNKVVALMSEAIQKQIRIFHKRDMENELELWNSLFSICWGEKLDDEWNTNLMEVMKPRIEQLKEEDVVTIFSFVHDRPVYHKDIVRICTDIAFVALDKLIQKNSEHEKIFNILSNSPKSVHCVQLLTKLLEKTWPKPHNGVEPSRLDILTHMITWPPMQGYMSFFCKFIH